MYEPKHTPESAAARRLMILRMPLAELNPFIEEQIGTNPLLEESASTADLSDPDTSTGESGWPVVPDVCVEVVDGGDCIIYFPADSGSSLRLSDAAQQAALADPGIDPRRRELIKEQARSAVALMRDLAHRHEIIYRVVEHVMRRGSGPEGGVAPAERLNLVGVAEALGVKLETIRSAVGGKCVLLPQGVVRLEGMFAEDDACGRDSAVV